MLYKIIAVHGDLVTKTNCISFIYLQETAGRWSAELIQHKSMDIGISGSIQELLALPIQQYNQLNQTVSIGLAKSIQDFINDHQLEHKVDFVALEGLKAAEHLYIGEPATLACMLSLPVISEFDKMNAALGGGQNVYAISQAILQINAESDAKNKNIAIALLGALRWREAYNILATDTNAAKNHIGGSLWLGVEA
jgi:protein involved in ribonucleotide reduction